MASPISFQCPKIYEFRNIEHFKNKLNKNGINPSEWKGGIKIEVLYDEWKKGECVFEKDLTGIIKKAKVVCVHCLHTNQEGKKLRLNEEKQIMPDGSERFRGYKFVSETMKPTETPEIAAKRALQEELQIDDPELYFEHTPNLDEDKIKESTTYSGLKCHYLIYHFKTEIPTKLFKERYEEIEDNVTTIFGWEKV